MKHYSYGDTVRRRAKHLLGVLLSYAYDELEGTEQLHLDLKVNWQTEKQLVVRTKLRTLEKLTEKDEILGKLTKEKIREAINHLKNYLKILIDNRESSRGSEDWHFTLELWSKDKEENLRIFDAEWQAKLPPKSKLLPSTSEETGNISAGSGREPPTPELPPPPEPQPQEDTLNENKEFEAFKIIIDTIKKQENKEIDVTTISANNYDLFIKVDKISPEHESVILDKSFACGGSGANTVCGLSRLGKKTAIVGCVKEDFEGKELIKSFRDFSVDTEFLIIDKTNAYNTKTGSTTVLVEKDSARRQIVVDPGINNDLSTILKNNEQLLEALVVKVKKSKLLHLSSFAEEAEMELQLTVLKQIRDDNIIVSLTPGAIYVEGGLDRLNRILAYTNILFLYIQQLDRLLERSPEIEGFEKHLSLKIKIKLFFEWRIQKQMTHPLILVIKNYSKSKANNIYKNHILVANHFDNCVSFFEHKFNEPRNQTIIPEDSTGTGDALAAGFLYGILKGEDIKTCTDFGFIMSREVSQRLGARANLPDENLLRSYL